MRIVRLGSVAAVAAAGCASLAPLDNPVLVRPAAGPPVVDPLGVENPALVAPGLPDPTGYAEVVESVIEVLNDYFELKPTARYAGYVESLPRVAPGFEQPWKPGSPAPRERLLATFQSIRHVAVARVTPGERGGFRVLLEVTKELEDLPRPMRSIYGNALFREQATLDRQVEVVGPLTGADAGWVRVGRDYAFEQLLLRRIQERVGRCKSSE
jgi:hypothetical protein